MIITSKSVSVPTTTTGFLSLCAKDSFVDMSAICVLDGGHLLQVVGPTLASCWHIHASVRGLCHLRSAAIQRSIGCCV